MVNGLLVIDKPKNYTSHDVVAICRKSFNQKRVGHTGTLDPLATGVLVMCLGKATRLSEYITGLDKVYEVTMKFGYATDSYDISGNITKCRYAKLSEEVVKDTLQKFIGPQNQYPPMYSAIKLKGKKLYELARAGKKVAIKARKIDIYDISFLSFRQNILRIKVHCSSGTYIRSLCHDLGLALNTFCTLTDLRRLSVGPFNIEDSISLDELQDASAHRRDLVLPMLQGVHHLERLKVPKEMILPLKQGKSIKLTNSMKVKFGDEEVNEIAFHFEEQLIGIGKVKKIDGVCFAKLNKCFI